MLLVALNERLPDAYKLLPPAGHPGPGEGWRRSLREVVADRRAARTSRHPDAPASGWAMWRAARHPQAALPPYRARAGAVGERRVAETLRVRATDPDPAARRQDSGDPPAERERGQQDQERDRQDQERDGRSGSATASPRTTSATVGAPTGSAPSTSARPTAGRCPSRHRAPPTGCRSAATTTRRITSRPTGRAAGWMRSATAARTADLAIRTRMERGDLALLIMNKPSWAGRILTPEQVAWSA